MRFLFSFAGGSGHFFPTQVFARTLAQRGHDIRYTCQEAMVATVARAGWPVEPSGGRSLLDPEARRPLVPADRQAEERAVRDFFAGRGARERAYRLVDLLERWQPDLIVRDEMDFGAAVAAEAVGLPHAAVVVISAGGFSREGIIGQPLAALRSEFGLVPAATPEALHRYLLLVPVPPTFRDPRDPLPPSARHVRPAILEDLPAIPSGQSSGPGSGPPHVYFTLGTVFPQESGDLFQRVLAGLVELGPSDGYDRRGHHCGRAGGPAFVGADSTVLALERDASPERRGGLPWRVRYRRVRSGSRPSTSPLAHGRRSAQHRRPLPAAGSGCCPGPVYLHAKRRRRCRQHGAPDPRFRHNAERLAAEGRALPNAAFGASLLEQVAQTGSPITA